MSSMPQHRIGIVVPLAEKRGGAEQALLDFLVGLPADRRDSYELLFLKSGPMVEESHSRGFSTTVVDAGRLRQFGKYLRTLVAVRRWIRSNNLSLVFAWMSKAHLYTSLPARLSSAKAVWFQFDIFAGSRLDRLNSRLPTDLVFCCSEAGARAQHGAFPSVPVKAVHLAVDHERFNMSKCAEPRSARARIGLEPDRQLVTLVARLERWKGVHVFVDAAIRLLRQGRDLQFAIVGSVHPTDPGYAEELASTIADAGFMDRIVMAGHQTNVPDWMCGADVVVHTSTKPEPFGIVMLEAMALGRPLIASRGGGPAEVISDGVDGVLISPGDPDRLSAAISTLIDDQQLSNRLATQAPVTAAAYTPERFAAEVDSTLLQLTESE